jgi:hypothetical protein
VDSSLIASSLSDFRKHRLQFHRSGPFFTVFLSNSAAIGRQIRQKPSSLGPNFASMPKVRQAARFFYRKENEGMLMHKSNKPSLQFWIEARTMKFVT